MISEHRPTTVVKILETAFFNNGANLRKLIDKSRLTEYPEKMKLYLLILENSGLIAYHKTDGVYRTTYKGMHFLRTYNHTFDLLSNFEKSQEEKLYFRLEKNRDLQKTWIATLHY